MLEFKSICIHNKRSMSVELSQQNRSTTASTLSGTYYRWLTKIKNNNNQEAVSAPHQHSLISDVSGKLLSGQVTVLTGASGSGKSVLLRVLAGLLPMDSGEVCLQSVDQLHNPIYHSIHDTEPTQWRTQVSLLAQHPQLLEGSVLDNLQMPYNLQAHQHRNFDMDWHITQLSSLGRSADFLQQEANYLSGGERQLVNTLRLLQLSPQVLLLDEPTAALDSEVSTQLVHLLVNWARAETQRTLLWVTHDTQDVMPFADQHWSMQAGVLSKVF
ncbi:ABC transporter ATP-binding protein [Psychrobacter namhaensis]|uniref:ABC transporter ATP-binding protein n=1 Tax=Psychrobacter namhaensis TaxID=292734 RepID=UPI003D039A93